MTTISATFAALGVSLLLCADLAEADSLSYRQIGGPQSLEREIIGLKSDMTDEALDAEARRACPNGYQSDSGVGFTKPDCSKWWRFTFFCLDPSAEGSTETSGSAFIAR